MPIVRNPGPPARSLRRAAGPPARADSVADVAAAAQAVQAVPGGVRLRFAPAPGVLRALDRAVARARLDGTCLRFAVHAPPGGPITLTITGPPQLLG